MSRNPMLALGLAGALALGASAAQAQNNSQMNSNPAAKPNASSSMNNAAPKASKADQHFLTEAIQGDMAEVEMGKLAQQNGQSEDVKQFGQMLETDHGQHLQQAQQMAQQMGVTPPNGPAPKHKAMHDKLAKEQGAKFDKAFAQAMVKDHKDDIAKYQKQAKAKGELGQFAQQTLPVLQKHLQTAQSIQNKGAMTGAKSGAK